MLAELASMTPEASWHLSGLLIGYLLIGVAAVAVADHRSHGSLLLIVLSIQTGDAHTEYDCTPTSKTNAAYQASLMACCPAPGMGVKIVSMDQLVEQLKLAAMAASRNAYCPYSHFRVGAAVISDTGEIFAGCNVENAAYGSTMCAERNAIFQAIAKGAKKIRAVLVYTPTQSPTLPCGSCRQVINEFGSDAEIFSVCDGVGFSHYHKLRDLLPEAFGPGSL